MGPFKCPDCGIWWAGFEHRCAPTQTVTNGTSPVATNTVRCTCRDVSNLDPQIRGALARSCPIHDVQWTYTLLGA